MICHIFKEEPFLWPTLCFPGHQNLFNPFALRMAKTVWSFGCSECNRVKMRSALKGKDFAPRGAIFFSFKS